MLGKIEDRKIREGQRMRWLDLNNFKYIFVGYD